MSEIINSAVIKVEIDAAGVEVGLRKIDEGAAKTGKSLENLGRADGFSNLGTGADGAASQLTGASKKIAASIERQMATMELGKRGTNEYYIALANQKGINPAALKPYLDQLDAVTRKTALAAEAQRKADDGARFVEGLRARTAEIGKSASELALMRAEQLGVSDAAAPLIARLQESEEAASGFGGALGLTTGALASFLAGLAGAVTIGGFVASVTASIDALADLDDMAQKTGSAVETLSRLQKVAQVAGQDFGLVDSAISKLAKGMGGLDEDSNKVISALGRLGISTKDIANQDPSKVFIEAAKRLQGYADGARKTALINDLLGKSGADLLPYLNDVADGVDKFKGSSEGAAKQASAFKDNIALLGVRFSEIGLSIAANVLPSLFKFSEYIKELVDSGKFKEWIDGVGTSVGRLATLVEQASAILVPAVQVAAAYFAVFVAAPAVIAGTTAALTALYGVVGSGVVALATSGGLWAGLTTTLFGTAVAANTAAGGLFTLKTAAAGLFAAFAGWQIGTYLRDEFAIVRIAGLRAFEALDTGFENIKYYSALAFDAMSFAWDKVLGDMKVRFAGYIQSVADGLGMIGATDVSASVAKYAESLRAAGVAQLALAAKTVAGSAEMTKSHESTLASIKRNTAELVEYESVAGRIVESTRGPKKENGKPPPPGVGGKGGNGPSAEIATAYEATTKAIQALDDARATAYEGLIKEAEANENLVRTFGMSKLQIEEMNLAKDVARLNDRANLELSERTVAQLEREIGARKRNIVALTELDNLTVGKKASEDLDKFLDPARAKDFGEALSDAFGSAGSALNKLTNSLENYGSRQSKIDDARKNAKTALNKGTIDEATYARKVSEINERSAKNQLGSYGQMTSAAAGFFSEQSRGYKGLQAASQVFHAAELAMTLKGNIASGIAAVLNQGKGDTYSAFARMAAMAAVVTGLGVAIGGGSSDGGGAKAEDVQKTQGSGGVFGDSAAQSASISRAIDLIEKNTYQGLDYSAGMLNALLNIEASMGGLTNILIRTPGVANGTNFGIETGQINIGQATDGISKQMTTITKSLFAFTGFGDKIAGFLNNLWGKTKQEIVDSGLKFGGSLDSLQAGNGLSQYASVNTTKSSYFGLKKKTTNSVQTASVDGELADQFGLIFTGLEETLKSAAVGMGLGADSVAKSLANLVVETSTISLNGLKGDDLTAALNAVISKAMDQVASTAFPSFDAFRKVGEGYAETVIRVANNFQAINVVFESFGKVFGQVGLQSLAARERLIELSGGLEKFTSQGEYFLTNFFSESEQAAALKKRIQPTLTEFGLSTEGPDATKAFRDLVVGLDTTTQAGAAAYATLMRIAPAFDEIVKSGKAELEERRTLQDQLDSLTMTSAQLLNKQREALMGSNRALFDQVRAATAAKEAQDAAKSSLGDVITRMKSFAESTRSLRDGLMVGSLSTLTPQQQYDEAKRQYESTLAKAKNNDVAAQGNFGAMQSAFLSISQKLNGGDATYSADFAAALKNSDDLSTWAAGQVDVAQASLDALNAQVAGIGQLNVTMQAIADGLLATPAAIASPPVFAGAPNYSTMGTLDMAPMAAEIKALREQVKTLTDQSAQQTGALIISNEQIQNRAADKIVTGVTAGVKPQITASNSGAALDN